ncbi:hypothetical protein HYW55_04070 [Candidatus Gottesmanbacteria bacterium]|nr:hypothetical protein [Candidatus Gottesmanbacteria bacterium]
MKGGDRVRGKLLIIISFIALGGLVLFGGEKVFAQDTSTRYQSIIEKLVQRFGLKESDVQEVFDEAFEERRSQMETRFVTMLDQEVKDGKLTEDQKKAIISKRQELQAKHQANIETWKNMTRDERRQVFQSQKQDLESWAKQNGIDVKYLFGGFKGHIFMKMGMW